VTAPLPIEVVVMTRDEAANIGECLASLRGFRRVFVVDSGSADGTAALAAHGGATVVPYRWDGRYPKKKQWCLDNLPFAGDWVLFVDADERVTPALEAALRRAFATPPDCAAFWIEGRYVFLGRRLRFGHRNAKLALLHRRRARFPVQDDLAVGRMWEVEGHYQPKLDGPAGRLGGWLWHDDRKPLFAWFDRHNRYTDWAAAMERRSGLAAHEAGHRRLAKAVVARLPLRGLLAFLHSYVWRLGLLDGGPGFHFAVARGVYYWQAGLKRRAETEGRHRGGAPGGAG